MQNVQEMGKRLQSARKFFTQTRAITPLPNMIFNNALRLYTVSPTKSIPEMPVLAAVAKAGKGLINFEDTAFFSVQHILRTNTPLFKHLIEDFNVKPNNIYLSGKGYSDSREAEDLLTEELGIQYFKLEKTYTASGQYQQHLRAHLKQVWHHFIANLKKNNIKRILVIDEGGHSLETMPDILCFKYPMAGIEQTRGGLYSPAINSLPFPLIEVASSAIKRHLESPLIVEAAVNKLHKALGTRKDIDSETVFGVIGNGAIGSSVIHYLLQRGHTVVAYDENKGAFQGLIHQNLYRVQNVSAVIARAEYILGCTGKDTLKDTKDNFLETTIGHKKLISFTSEDKEFYSIRKAMDMQKSIELDNRGDVIYHTEAGGKVTLINGGFPMNFDQSGESVPALDIQLTRALMLGACIQAGRQASKPEGGSEMELAQRIQLNSVLQHFVAQEFRKYQPTDKYSLVQWQLTQDLKWIKNNSGGKEQYDAELEHKFSSGTCQISAEETIENQQTLRTFQLPRPS